MGNLEIVTTADRQDLDEQARNAFRPGWPEFIFHDPVSSEHLGRVETYFPQYDVLLLDEDQVVAGGWGVPIRWNGTIGTLPDGYDGALISAVTGHEKSVPADTLMHHGRRGQGRPARQRAGGPDPHRTPHPSRQRRAATCDRTGQANAQKPVSADADGKLRTLGPKRRAAYRPVDPHASAARGQHPRLRPPLHDHHCHCGRMGRLGGHGFRKPASTPCPVRWIWSPSTTSKIAGHTAKPTYGCATPKPRFRGCLPRAGRSEIGDRCHTPLTVPASWPRSQRRSTCLRGLRYPVAGAASRPNQAGTRMLSPFDLPRCVSTSDRRRPGLIGAGLAARPRMTVYWEEMPR